MTATRPLSASLRHLNSVILADELSAVPDAELVGRFVERRDEVAFTALVRRYGGVVFGVCRRVLRHEQDAEDAFQATFLVLARDAASVQRAGAVGNWLYGVAHNVARKARTTRHRREVKERLAAARSRVEVSPVVPDDLPGLIDAELGALPSKYRRPIVLCDLLGLTTQQAAAEVGCPPKTLGTRLSRGRTLLGQRLTRRGVALPAAGVGVFLTCNAAPAAVPPALLDSTARAAVAFTTGSATVPPAVAALTTGVTNVMVHTSLKFALLACGVLVVAGLTGRPLMQHLHAAHAPRAAKAPGGAPGRAAVPPRQFDHLQLFHNFLLDLLPWDVAGRGTEPAADDKKEEKEKALTGTWVKKEGEMKIEFDGKEVKLYPHGENKVIVVVCEYTRGKDDLVKAKITGLEGKDEAKMKFMQLVPIGTEFRFKWTVKKDAATLSDLKDDNEKVDRLKSHLEGDFEEKK